MRPTRSQLQSWRPVTLGEAGTGLRTKGQTYEDLLRGSERDLDRLSSGWEGDASAAADRRVRQEISFGRRISAGIETVSSALTSGDRRLDSSRRTVLNRVAAAEEGGFRVADDFSVSDPRTYDLLDPADLATYTARSALVAAHADQISTALTDLARTDQQVSYDIDAALDELRATAQDVREGREYLPPASPQGMTAAEVRALTASSEFREWMERHPDAAKTWLDSAVDAGLLDPRSTTYSTFLTDYWQAEALEAAGIDLATWDPSQGTEANAENIRRVYEYYGRLFLDDPDLQWAGMANMIGPSFAGGFFDLDMLRRLSQAVEDGSGGIPDVPGPVDDELRSRLEQLGSLSDEELAYYETTLLGMQQEIFFDQASMHQAYLMGGTAETDRMAAAGLTTESTRLAWHDIASGDPDRVSAGNAELLHREQWEIIADDYDQMRSRPGTGEVVTWGMTLVGSPSIPGAQTYAEEMPLVIDLETPGSIGPVSVPSVDLGHLSTPLPDGNVADRYDRWELISRDTLPAYQRLLAEDPERAREIIASDFGQRMDEQRLESQMDDIVRRLVTDWEYRP